MLSKKCQYALHALIYLGQHQDSGLIYISEIAEAKKIPKKFLEAILLDLKNTNILGSKKGKGGGYYLKRKPQDIAILQVVRAIDGAVSMLPCVSLNFYETCGICENEKQCTINHLFSQVRDETLKILSKNTLADLIKPLTEENKFLSSKLGETFVR